MNKTRILVVEDEIVVSEDLQQRLLQLGHEVVGAADNAAEAILLATATRPDVALMDIMLHGRPEGIQAAEHLRRELDIAVIYLTAHSDSATLQKAKLTDPYGYIVKPFAEPQLKVAIEMAPHRHAMERKLNRLARWLGATLTSIGDAVIATNITAEILFLNPAAERLTGWNLGDAIGKPCREVLRLVGEKTRQPLEDPATCALRHGLVIHLAPDTLLITRNGEERRVADSASPITDQTGQVLGAVVVLANAKDRVAAARSQVQALTDQVKELLAEKDGRELLGGGLEAFAAAVSHDLRAPLRSITGFSRILAESYQGRLDTEGQKFLDQIQTSARQMNCMVDNYLVFLKLARQQPPHLTLVDVKGLAETVFAELSTPSRKPVRLICGPLPQAWAEAAMVRQVLANLLGNALKYSSQREQPVIEVGATPGEAVHTFFVRDNGTGLELESAARLLEPFQRFHNSSDFPGTGVGLTIVKTIVERNGGRIWAESEPGAGATFFFTLPASEPKQP